MREPSSIMIISNSFRKCKHLICTTQTNTSSLISIKSNMSCYPFEKVKCRYIITWHLILIRKEQYMNLFRKFYVLPNSSLNTIQGGKEKRENYFFLTGNLAKTMQTMVYYNLVLVLNTIIRKY